MSADCMLAAIIVVIVSADEIVAECTGPNKAAYCTLIDRRDGMFELIVKPQEVGTHKLQIMYGCEPVPGMHQYICIIDIVAVLCCLLFHNGRVVLKTRLEYVIFTFIYIYLRLC